MGTLIWGFPKMGIPGYPQNEWFIMGNPTKIKMMNRGTPGTLETTICPVRLPGTLTEGEPLEAFLQDLDDAQP